PGTLVGAFRAYPQPTPRRLILATRANAASTASATSPRDTGTGSRMIAASNVGMSSGTCRPRISASIRARTRRSSASASAPAAVALVSCPIVGHRRICLHRSWRARPVLVGRRQLRRVLAVPLGLPPRQESGRGVIQVVELLGVRPEKLAG